jgi:serine/threonine protein kinase
MMNVNNSQALSDALVMHSQSQVGKLIHEGLGKTLTFKQLEELAQEYGYTPLLNALEATQNMTKLDGRVDLQNNLLETSLYIETSLQKHLAKNENRMQRGVTGQFFTLEHDPVTHRTFIHTEEEIGKGVHKATRLSYEYHLKNPLLIANSITDEECSAEIGKFKLFQGVKNVLQARSITTYLDKNGKKKTSFKTPLYNLGPISQGKAAQNLLSHEKFQVAVDILTGLNGIHQKGYIHRDVHPGNIFVYQNKGQTGASIGDFGTTNTEDAVKGLRPNSYTLYNPPEAFTNLHAVHYQKAEGFSAAVVIYELLFTKELPWTPGAFFHNIDGLPQDVKLKNQAAMKQALEKERLRLKSTIDPKNTREENLLREVLCNLLHQNVDERMTVAQALHLLNPDPVRKPQSFAESLSLDEVSVKDERDNECAICLENYKFPLLETFECHHVFCKSCIHTWHTKNKTCPIDRGVIDITKAKELSEIPHKDKIANLSLTILFCDEEIKPKKMALSRTVFELKEHIATEVNKLRKEKELAPIQTKSFVLVLLSKGENVVRLVPKQKLESFGLTEGQNYEISAVAKYTKDGKIPCDECYEHVEKEASCGHREDYNIY